MKDLRSKISILLTNTFIMIFILILILLSNYAVIKGSRHHSAASAASSSLGNKGNKGRSGGNNHNNIVNSNYQNYFNSDDLSDVNLPDEQILINKLLKFYDPAARPVFNASQPVIIKFSFALIQICDMVFMMIF